MASQTPQKSMSSRLLTMKFMQRAAASPSSNPTTPTSDEQSSKRRKVSHNSTVQQDVESLVNQKAIQAAIAEDERKREEALLKHATESGDGRWVLNVPENATGSRPTIQAPLNVVQVGYAQIDSANASGHDTESTDVSQNNVQAFRRTQAPKVSRPDSDDSSSDSGSDSDSDASSSEEASGRQSYGKSPQTPAAAIRNSTSRKPFLDKRSAERAKGLQFAEKRRKKEVKLNTLSSLSSRGGSGSISSGGNSTRPPIAKAARNGKGTEAHVNHFSPFDHRLVDAWWQTHLMVNPTLDDFSENHRLRS
ncbi:Uu.00g058560.m01.CDS01 [Anthostomella pinea]|uniref:Uu.00g058560.m01.CDS01 n=1 Tax=Anthostomella pinea TaxID=933095 RepID=A0AAI8VRT8_9PEZI|nr:Uu.00g058560.m01.CDS01 [Anthostomella pinea]